MLTHGVDGSQASWENQKARGQKTRCPQKSEPLTQRPTRHSAGIRLFLKKTRGPSAAGSSWPASPGHLTGRPSKGLAASSHTDGNH